MDGLRIYSNKDILKLVNIRSRETKLGERVKVIATLEDLNTSEARFVLLGIPEDIGVRANYGLSGTSTAWGPALKALLNTQSNRFLDGSELVVLGHFEFTEPQNNTIEAFQKKVSEIDNQVYECVLKIIAAGKTPIIVGGGHNNAYPIIKALASVHKKAVDILNIDAHADLREPKGRHSGNSFSYALKEGYLAKYGIFGLHHNYNNEAILKQIEENEKIQVVFFDDILLSDATVTLWTPFISAFKNPGLEIDLDSIENMLSSAATPSGFSLNDIRKLILRSSKQFAYLHICEGASEMADGRTSSFTGKSIAYLITDFLKSYTL
ncbi:formimidoylglutamase [Pedobacter panaciterrae]|jgi:Arginase/agmatinase/formimionoglutamate hydrolase, arginase family|uniref:Formimidoylglutamase n=1 Tax=Pedobacter panaciterrae TaxID=363849 RepID=A0ABU8NPZ2_9SPHI|nr:formimidoylglutamase [uncultured Pedobacter sp.]